MIIYKKCSFLLISVLLFVFEAASQLSPFQFKEVVSFLGRPKQTVIDAVRKEGYIQKSHDENMYSFALNEGMMRSSLIVAFKAGKTNAISWSENLVYCGNITNGILDSDFVLIEQNGNIFLYADSSRGLILNLFLNTAGNGIVTMSLGYMANRPVKKQSTQQSTPQSKKRVKGQSTPTSDPPSNKPRAIMPKRD